MIKQLNSVPGSRIDIADIARQLQASAPPASLEPLAMQAQLRRDLFDIETTEKTLQRKLIDPPTSFAQGTYSMTDKDRGRQERTRMYFGSAFGGKKFAGNPSTDEMNIIHFLTDFNNAQRVVHLTEHEFVTFLTKATTGDALKTMLNFLELHRQGNMSIDEIYASLTDIYFSDVRPSTASAMLRDMHDSNHKYSSLSEAHKCIQELAHLASLASRSKDRQTALAADHYQQTLIRIIPRDYRPMAISSIESMANYKRADLNPHQILACLAKIRQPIDDQFRRMQQRPTYPRVKMAEAFPPPPSPPPLMSRPVTRPDDSFPRQGPRTDDTNGRGRRSAGAPDCKHCGNPSHKHDRCPLFPEGRNAVASFECRKCRSGLFHFTKHCPRWEPEAAQN